MSKACTFCGKETDEGRLISHLGSMPRYACKSCDRVFHERIGVHVTCAIVTGIITAVVCIFFKFMV